MKRNRITPELLAITASSVVLICSGIALSVLGALTKYLPLYLLSFLILMPSVVNTLTIVLRVAVRNERNTTESSIGHKGVKKILKSIGHFFVKLFSDTVTLYNRCRTVVTVSLISITLIVFQILFWTMQKRMTSLYRFTYLLPVILTVLFLVFVALEKWCVHTETDSQRDTAGLRSIATVLTVSRFGLLLTTVSIVIKLLGFYEPQKILVIAICVIWCYVSLFLVLSITVQIIRREFSEAPELYIPIPFSSRAKHDLGILTYLEKNTGITMRSLWSMKLVRTIAPFAIILTALLIWLSTSVVQIGPYQTGAVYRFGKLESDLLSPGIHLVFPWPVDTVDIRNTETVNKITIGYNSTEDTDNIWTSSHGSNEYKLLLGSGDEVVSINLRIEYKISDLFSYLTNNKSPEKLLEAQAYELVTEKTIDTDLETLLSYDRGAFSADFRDELSKRSDYCGTGLSVVSVVLESIHPPVEIAEVYQGVIGAEIDAEKIRLTADGIVNAKIAEAEMKKYKTVSNAEIDSNTKLLTAQAEVRDILASVGLDSVDYRQYRYLEALRKAYGSARLVIIGNGIDQSNIYLGNLPVMSD